MVFSGSKLDLVQVSTMVGTLGCRKLSVLLVR